MQVRLVFGSVALREDEDAAYLSTYGVYDGAEVFASLGMKYGCECCQEKIDAAIALKQSQRGTS